MCPWHFFGTNNLTGSAQPARIASSGLTELLRGARRRRAVGPHLRSARRHTRLQPEVVISDGLWKRAFGADPHILGKALRLDNDVYHVVGVMPAGFRDQGQTSEERSTELWAAAGFYGDPAPPPMRVHAFPLRDHRAPSAWSLACGRAGAPRCPGCIVEEAISGGLSAQGRVDCHLTPLAETLSATFANRSFCCSARWAWSC
jgi:hypothetical protein